MVAKDRSKLSQRPEQIRNRLRRGGKAITQDLAILAEVKGQTFKPVSEWSFEELSRGRPKNADGKFPTGPRPAWLTPLILEEIQRRLKEKWGDAVKAELPTILKVLKTLLTNDENPRIQLDAAKLMLAYAVGEPEKNVAISNTNKVETLLADIIVIDDGEAAHPVIDGQFYEEDDDADK